MSTNVEIVGSYLAEFERIKKSLNGEKSSQIFVKKQQAIEFVEKLGIPTRKHEEWRFTNLSFLNKSDFLPVNVVDDVSFEKRDVEKHFIEGYGNYRLVFVNGCFSEKLSSINTEKNEIIVGSLEEFLAKDFAPAIENFSKFINNENSFFSSLNTALSPDGAFVYVHDGIAESEPIQLLFLNDGRETSPFVQARNLLVVGENSQVKIVCRYATIGENDAFVNIVTECKEDRYANIELYGIHDDEKSFYINTTEVNQQEGSVFNDYKVNIKGKFVRNDLNSKLDGEHCEANLNGIYYLTGKDFADNHTLIDHAKPNSNSNEFYKGILDDSSSAVFNGKIYVRQDAQKTNAFQTNRNVLLSDNAKINTKPQLEIFADDVKCSHGATSGALDESSMFYLQSRGISRDDAKSMLIMAFANDLIDKFDLPELQKTIRSEISNRLGIHFEEII